MGMKSLQYPRGRAWQSRGERNTEGTVPERRTTRAGLPLIYFLSELYWVEAVTGSECHLAVARANMAGNQVLPVLTLLGFLGHPSSGVTVRPRSPFPLKRNKHYSEWGKKCGSEYKASKWCCNPGHGPAKTPMP